MFLLHRSRILGLAGAIWLTMALAACAHSKPAQLLASVDTVRLPAGVGNARLPDSGTSAPMDAIDSGAVVLALEWPMGGMSGHPAAVLRSLDAGHTWTRVPLPGPGGGSQRDLWAAGRWAAVSAIEPGNGLLGRPVVRTSSDSGRSWQAAELTDPRIDGGAASHTVRWRGRWVAVGTVSPKETTAGHNLPAVWTSDDGRSWTLQDGALGRQANMRVYGLEVIGTELWASSVGTDGSGQMTWRSSDGVSWRRTQSSEPIGHGLLSRYKQAQRRAEVSSDAGRSWATLPTPKGAVPPPEGDGSTPIWFASHSSRAGGYLWLEGTSSTTEHEQDAALYRQQKGKWRQVPLPRLSCPEPRWPNANIYPPRSIAGSLVVVATCESASDTADPPQNLDVFVSYDNGDNWSRLALPSGMRTGNPVAFATDGHSLAVTVSQLTGQDTTTTKLLTIHP